MTASFERVLELAVPADRLLELIIDPDYQRQKALDFGATEASCNRTDQPDGTVELVLRETSGGQWGRKPQPTTLTFRWDLQQRRSTWRRVIHGHEDRSRAEGASRIVESDDGRSCRLILEGEVQVRVPVLGRVIERRVVEEIERGRERELRYLREKLGIG